MKLLFSRMHFLKIIFLWVIKISVRQISKQMKKVNRVYVSLIHSKLNRNMESFEGEVPCLWGELFLLGFENWVLSVDGIRRNVFIRKTMKSISPGGTKSKNVWTTERRSMQLNLKRSSRRQGTLGSKVAERIIPLNLLPMVHCL